MSEAIKPDRYECQIVVGPDGKHAHIELVEDASGGYVRLCDLGLTHEDVKLLRYTGEEDIQALVLPNGQFAINDLADRISALLPPEGK